MQESINIESATIQWKWIVADRMALSTMWVAFREINFYVWKYLCNNLPELQRSISIPPEKIQWIWIVADLTPKPLHAGWKQLMQLLQHNKMSLCVLNLLSKHLDILIYKIFLFVVYRYNSLKSCDPGWVQAGNWVGRCKWQLGHTSVAVTLTYTLIRYLAFSINIFLNLDKYILQFGQIHFALVWQWHSLTLSLLDIWNIQRTRLLGHISRLQIFPYFWKLATITFCHPIISGFRFGKGLWGWKVHLLSISLYFWEICSSVIFCPTWVIFSISTITIFYFTHALWVRPFLLVSGGWSLSINLHLNI